MQCADRLPAFSRSPKFVIDDGWMSVLHYGPLLLGAIAVGLLAVGLANVLRLVPDAPAPIDLVD